MATLSNYDQQVRDFFGYLRVEAGLSPATLEAYRHDLEQLQEELVAQGVTCCSAVTPKILAAHIRRLHRERGLQASSVARHLSTIRMLFRFLQASNRIDSDPARLLETPTRWKKLPDVLSPKKMKRMIEAANPKFGRLWKRDRALVELMYAGGMRASEVAGIKPDDFKEKSMATLMSVKRPIPLRSGLAGIAPSAD